MPIIKSAKKRVRVATKATIRNKKTKRSLKESLKAFYNNVSSKDASKKLSEAQGEIDRAVKKGIMSKNKAARKKSQLATAAKANNVKPTAGTAKSVTKKTAAKKTTAKKATTKKPATKKAAPKKSTAKKSTTKK